MTERERRAILRKRPNVTSWRELFEAAEEERVAAFSKPRGSVARPA
jgi:WhiB family redox-sensing transcriptional regulator